MAERRFPIQRVDWSIPWWLAELCYDRCGQIWHGDQTLERLAERGGWGLGELGRMLVGLNVMDDRSGRGSRYRPVDPPVLEAEARAVSFERQAEEKDAEIERLRGIISELGEAAVERQAEVEELREALEPFMTAYQRVRFEYIPDLLTRADFDRAVAILDKARDQEGADDGR